MRIIINYDFTSGNEVSYMEVIEKITSEEQYIETHCLNFFNFDMLKHCEDIVVIKKDNSYISVKDLLENKGDGYCYKEIREAHNIYKILMGGLFDFKKIILLDYDSQLPFTRDPLVQNVYEIIKRNFK